MSVVWPAQITNAVDGFPRTRAGTIQTDVSPDTRASLRPGSRARRTLNAASISAEPVLRAVISPRAQVGEHAASKRQSGAICGGYAKSYRATASRSQGSTGLGTVGA